MPRELEIAGVLMPSLLAALVLAAVLYLPLDWALARVGFYRRVWHLHLFRLALFSIIFGGLGLLLYS